MSCPTTLLRIVTASLQPRVQVSLTVALGAAMLLAFGGPSLAAPPPTLPPDWFAGGWVIRYSAYVQPGVDPAAKQFKRKPVTSDDGTTFSDYQLSFDSRETFAVGKEGKLSIEDGEASFHHQAKWKTADGKAGQYQFGGAGTLHGSGQFDAQTLKLQLEWTSGAGQGVSDGKPITEPVAAHSGKSEWTLKLDKVKVKFGSADAKEVLSFTASRRSTMPQQLAGCPPLPLVEQVEMYKAPTADLEVTAKASPNPAVLGGRLTLKITVKNLGPEPAHGIELRFLLPDGAKIISPKEYEDQMPGIRPLTIPLSDLAKDAKTEFELVYEDTAKRPSNAKEADSITLVLVSSAAHDPNPGNNGHFERTTLRAESGSKP